MEGFGVMVERNRGHSQADFERYKEVRREAVTHMQLPNVWPDYQNYAQFLEDVNAPVLWLSCKE